MREFPPRPLYARRDPSPATVQEGGNRAAPRVVSALWATAFAVALACASPALAQPDRQAPAAEAPAPAPAKPRPKVGLVLSGGGARGLTHVGVLEVLHEMRIPIDYIAATSMGAIVGGLYASGMTPDAMQRHLGAVSWPTLLSDSPPRQDVAFRRKEEVSAFPLGFELGYSDGQILWFKGALSGSNLELFLHELTRSVDTINDFDKLPIPFRAVATNMVNGKEVVFDRGRLYHAMRASMSVPGMFAPLELDGKIYGDGGLVNNLPVDVVRAMGAEVVIAVNIGTPLMSRDQLQSVAGYATQMINILTEQNVRAQLAQLRPGDILISPDLGNLTFIDFAAAPRFVELGREAAEAMRPQLAALADTPASFAARGKRDVAPPLPERLDFVTIEGTKYANPDVLEEQMRTREGGPLDIKVLEGDLARLHGRGEFEEIDYEVVTIGRQQGLVVKVTEKSWGPNFLRFGLSLSTDLQGETWFNLMAGHKRVWVNRLGAEWTNEIILGSTRRYATEFYQPLTLSNRVFTAAYGLVQRAPEYAFDGATREAEYDVLTQTAGLDLGVPFGTAGELRVGFKWEHKREDPVIAPAVVDPNLLIPNFTVKSDETGARVLFRWDTLDNPYFPRQGVRVNAEGFFGNRSVSLPTCPVDVCSLPREPSSRAGVYANVAVPLGRRDFLNVAGQVGAITRTRVYDPFSDFNLGGFLQLSGLRTGQLSGDYLGFARAVYYHQIGNLPLLGRGVYVGGSLEAGDVWAERSDVSLKGIYTAGSVFVAADTWIGPFYFAWGRASGGATSFYIYLGRL
ncbi:MAG: patatin-like phospholipase family protein [Betaproteobacteria bacterium]|nr:patatin-like phospholipase family protein [Betaproteobacteria bacterium]